MNLLNKILKYCIRDVGRGYYANNIAKELNMNQKTVSNHLHNLKKEGFMITKIQGKNKLFFFNKKDKQNTRNLLLKIEIEKNQDLIKNNFMMKEIISKLNLKSPCLIFGSYAKELNKKDSDLDLFVIGDYNKNEIEQISRLYNIEINVVSMHKKEFIRSIKDKDIFINEIIKDHIIINGFEFFVSYLLSY